MKQRLALTLFFLILFQSSSFALFFQKKDETDEPKYPPMVHTIDEWLEEGTAVKVDLRKNAEDIGKKDENFIPPEEVPTYLEPYNVKAGSRELDLSRLYKTRTVRSPYIADKNVKNAVYTEVYYYPQTKQAASTIYLMELDKNLGKKERLTNASIFEHKRYPLISTALPYFKNELFSTLTVVDFSSDGKKILVKEKIGSNRFGIYETYAWIYFITDKPREKSKCYLNNIDFSTENSPLIEGEFSSDIDNLSKPPEAPIKEVLKNSNSKNLKTVIGANTSSSIKNTVNPSLNIESNDSLSGFNINPEDLKNAINLDVLGNKGFDGKRWYNLVPVDFRVEDSYETGKENIGFGVRLNLLNQFIQAYWFNRKAMILNHIRWDLIPLGFSSSNSNEIIVKAISWTKDGREVSLGYWGVNIIDGMPRLIGDNENISIEANALVGVKKINPR